MTSYGTVVNTIALQSKLLTMLQTFQSKLQSHVYFFIIL